MPVVIRELVIRATVNDSPGNQTGSAPSPATQQNNEEREALIKECVEQVLEIIEKKKQR